MNTVGIFAGRGDVILGMAMASACGILVGWWIRGRMLVITNWYNRKFNKLGA